MNMTRLEFSNWVLGCSLLLISSSRTVRSFSTVSTGFAKTNRPVSNCWGGPLKASVSATDGWVSLTDDNAVQKRIIQEGSGDVAKAGQTVEIDYVGTLGTTMDWDVEDVIDCWLVSQQGLEGLADGFRSNGVDAAKLMDPSFFNEDFVTEAFDLSSKIQIKKLVMAAKRLAKTATEYPAGTQFDSNKHRGDAPYSFVLGKKKAIRAMELSVASMKEGEHAEIICRADYAYGKEGYRKADGDVMVPEYATLCFDIKLLKCI